MKKIILIVLALVTIQVSAQERKQEFRKGERKERINKFKDFSPEEVAELQTKRMTLDLDLTSSQQKQIQKLNLENAIDRKAKMEERQAQMKDGNKEKPSKEDRLKMMNERLDKQIEMKQKMAKILNSDQMEKWEKMKNRKQVQKYRKQKEIKHKRS
jgi:hypothetical protein